MTEQQSQNLLLRAQAAQAIVVRSYIFLNVYAWGLCERSEHERQEKCFEHTKANTRYRDTVTAVIYCYITTLRET